MSIKKVIYITIFTFAILLRQNSVSAAQVAITLKPSVNDIVTLPGKTIYQDLTFVNSGDPQVYTFRLYQLEPADTLGNYRVKPPAEELPVKVVITDPYIRLDKPFLMQSQRQDTLPVKIDIPENTPDSPVTGEYLFAIVAESEKPLSVEGTINSRISGGLGSLFFIRVIEENRDEKKVATVLFNAVTQISIPFFKSRFALVDSNTPIPFVFMLKNKGEHTVQPQGQISLKNMVDKKKTNYSLLPVYVHPGRDRIIPVAGYNIDQCAKNHGAEVCKNDYSYVHPGFSFGLIEASANVTFGEGSPLLYAHDFFIVIPFAFVWIFLIGSIGLIVLLIVWWKKHLQEAQKHPHRKSHIPH